MPDSEKTQIKENCEYMNKETWQVYCTVYAFKQVYCIIQLRNEHTLPMTRPGWLQILDEDRRRCFQSDFERGFIID